jgi:hypothetical protein
MENVHDKKFLTNFRKLSDSEQKLINSLITTILSGKNESIRSSSIKKTLIENKNWNNISQPKVKKSVLQLSKELIPDGKFAGLSSILEPYELGLE